VLETEQERLEVMRQQAADTAQGKRRRGRRPKSTWSEQKALLTRVTTVTEGVRSLCQELHTVLEVVVPHANCVLSSSQRQGEIEAVLELLDELASLAFPALQAQIQTLSKQIRLALSHPLLFARRLDAVQEQAVQALGPEAVALLAWAWLRRAHPGKRSPRSFWLPGITQCAPGARSSIGRAWSGLMAVHRTLSAGFFSLLAVWHHHQVAPRGLHPGLSPF
jgi:hypothetical protein